MAQDVSAQGDKQKSLALDPSQIQTGLISNGQEVSRMMLIVFTRMLPKLTVSNFK